MLQKHDILKGCT